jgi:DNA-binding transcriptional ArsR family regulator
MDERQAIQAIAALSQETRLRMVRLLVKAGPAGMAAGAIATATKSSASIVSFHLKELERAGLVTSERQGRTIIYYSNYATLTELITFLIEDCCSGHPQVCTADLARACLPSGQKRSAPPRVASKSRQR